MKFSLADLHKIGPKIVDGKLVFVDYDGTRDEWYTEEVRLHGLPVDDAGLRARLDRDAKTRRAVLKAMVTRRANKQKKGV